MSCLGEKLKAAHSLDQAIGYEHIQEHLNMFLGQLRFRDARFL